MQGAQVPTLVGELRSLKLCSKAKNKKFQNWQILIWIIVRTNDLFSIIAILWYFVLFFVSFTVCSIQNYSRSTQICITIFYTNSRQASYSRLLKQEKKNWPIRKSIFCWPWDGILLKLIQGISILLPLSVIIMANIPNIPLKKKNWDVNSSIYCIKHAFWSLCLQYFYKLLNHSCITQKTDFTIFLLFPLWSYPALWDIIISSEEK